MSKKHDPAINVKLKLSPYNNQSRTEICAHNYIPTQNLTLKVFLFLSFCYDNIHSSITIMCMHDVTEIENLESCNRPFEEQMA
jgi:hypothetical protein